MSTESSGKRVEKRVRTPIWAEPEPGRRRPSVTREQIAAKALEIADAEGLDAVSMRRVAADLGVGTMTLYHYVRTKDDLYSLMGNTIMGELLLDESEIDPVDWRSSIAAIGRRSRQTFARHPWMIHAMDEGGEMGPNGIRHFEQSLAAVEGTGLDGPGRLEIIALVDDLVFGHAFRSAVEERELRSDEWLSKVRRYVEEQLASGDFPQLERLLGDGDRQATWDELMAVANDTDRFEVGLTALLDGIARRIEAGG